MAIVTRYACDMCGKEFVVVPTSWSQIEVHLPVWEHSGRLPVWEHPGQDEPEVLRESIDMLVCDGACQNTTVATLESQARLVQSRRELEEAEENRP